MGRVDRATSVETWSIDARGLLRQDGKIYVPDDAAMRQELLRIHHDDPLAGHFGTRRTMELVRRKFYWKGLGENVRDYVSSCTTCQRTKL